MCVLKKLSNLKDGTAFICSLYHPFYLGGTMKKEKLLLKLSAYELSSLDIELYIDKKKRKRYFDKIISENNDKDAKEHLLRFEKKMKEFYHLQEVLNKKLDLFPELIKEENGFIHTKFYKYNTCKYTDKDVEYKKNLLMEFINAGNFISIRDFLEEQERVINENFLDQKEDENEVLIRTIDNLLKKKGKKK